MLVDVVVVDTVIEVGAGVVIGHDGPPTRSMLTARTTTMIAAENSICSRWWRFAVMKANSWSK
jgi:hypothetical protein